MATGDEPRTSKRQPILTIEINYTTRVRDHVEEYIRDGFGVVPVDAMQKGPMGSGWQNNSYGPEHFGPGSNIGAKGGKASRDIVPVDLDSPEMAAHAKAKREEQEAIRRLWKSL